MIGDLLPNNTIHALTALANSIQEICGFILQDGSIVIIPNDAVRPGDGFDMRKSVQRNFVQNSHSSILAVFHTHPRGICWPSAVDVENWPIACLEDLEVPRVKYVIATTREIGEFRLDENGKPKPVE
jgi:proteasome lid subunit RPN8/RPN11